MLRSHYPFDIFFSCFNMDVSIIGMTGPRGRTGRPGINGTPGIPGINAWKVKVNGTFSDQYLVPPSIAGKVLWCRII